MRKFSLFAASIIFAAVFASSAFGQAPASGKIGWINTGDFGDEKTGIAKYTGAYRSLATELKPRETELVGLQTKIQGLAEEIRKAQAATGVPVKPESLLAKQEEGQRLARELEFKKKEYDAFAEKRGSALIGPIQLDISRALQDFAKQKGYVAILDIDKLGQAGAILALDQTADITKEFITFYNARPAGTATAAAPK
jgi:Skp family chaperone for outer membrane proteins